MEQQEIWKRHTEHITVPAIVESYEHPNANQTELASFINRLCDENGYTSAIEVGCETGITLMLLAKRLRKTFLDFNNDVLEKVQRACNQLHIEGSYLNEDMFAMSCADGSQDVVFNAGVVEHYTRADRIRLLREYGRILSDRGTMIIAIPNHYSLPYRSIYLLRKKILFGYRWPFPDEFKIYDLEEEVKAAGMTLVQRTTLARETAFHLWKRVWPVQQLLLLTDRFVHYEGYLTTLLIRRR